MRALMAGLLVLLCAESASAKLYVVVKRDQQGNLYLVPYQPKKPEPKKHPRLTHPSFDERSVPKFYYQ